jgi:thiamine pyrophosphate-dependent acetolactate synthase large subunit-like protein
MNCGETLARSLAASGITDVYGVPAGKLSAFMGAIAALPDELRWTGVRHESAAAWMAGATHQATGRLAVAAAESGPGSHNLVGGLGSAHNNNVPLLVVVSGVPAHLERPAGLVMETDNDALFAACTKWRATVRDPAELPALFEEAVAQALGGRPGPVALSIPPDVLTAPGPEAIAARAPERPAADPELIAQAAALLRGAERPLLIAGGGVVAADAAGEFRALAEQLAAAATSTQMGLGTVSTESPWFFGHGGVVGGEAVVRACREADVVVVAGMRQSSWWWDGSRPLLADGRSQRLIQIDVDPQMIGARTAVGVGIVSDARDALAALVETLRGAPREPGPWLASLRSEYLDYREHLRAHELAADGRMHPAALARELGDALPAGSLVAYDGGHTTFWSNDLTPAREPRTRFHEPGMAHLGFGLPYALALKAHFPDRTAVNITGDGAFGFTLVELDTARRYGLAAITVIHDNEAWGVIRLGQERGGFELGTELRGSDYVAIARAFGCHAERIEEPGEVAPALERAIDSGLPAVIDARVGFEPHPGMRRFAAAGARE